MPIQNLGPSEMGRRGPERVANASEAALAKRERAAEGTGDATGTELHRTGTAEGAAPAASRPDALVESTAGDRVEISVAARALSAGEDPVIAARQSEQVAQVRSALDAGTLANSERIERAAQRLLGG